MIKTNAFKWHYHKHGKFPELKDDGTAKIKAAQIFVNWQKYIIPLSLKFFKDTRNGCKREWRGKGDATGRCHRGPRNQDIRHKSKDHLQHRPEVPKAQHHNNAPRSNQGNGAQCS